VTVLLVAIGGAFGSMARYLLSSFVHRVITPLFPFGTFAVNVLGCAVFGAIAGLAHERFLLRPDTRAFLLIGVLGGFTTFRPLRSKASSCCATGSFSSPP